jgi:hypothetical protein
MALYRLIVLVADRPTPDTPRWTRNIAAKRSFSVVMQQTATPVRRMCSDDDAVWLSGPFATRARVRILGVCVHHNLAAQIDPLRLGAGAESTK